MCRVGYIRKSNGSFGSIELNDGNPSSTYWLAINGVVYQEDGDSKYCYDEAGELQEILEGGFYPQYPDDFPGNMGEYERDQFDYYTFADGKDFYIIGAHHYKNKKVFYSSVRHILFKDDISFTQKGSTIPVIDEINDNGITSISLDGKMMYILTDRGLYSIDFVAMAGNKIHTDKYVRYISFWDLGPIGFELQVLDERGNTVSVLIDKEGNELSKEISDYCDYDHFSLSPLH